LRREQAIHFRLKRSDLPLQRLKLSRPVQRSLRLGETTSAQSVGARVLRIKQGVSDGIVKKFECFIKGEHEDLQFFYP